jgi:prepilin-type N-terminal cleavage/methylation domain-containing protein
MRSQGSRNTERSAGGFTLIEVIIAVALFMMGMLSLSAMQLHAMRGGSSGRHATQAAAIAESQMEQLQRLTWTQIAPTTGWSAGVARNNTVQSNPDQVEQAYTLDWRITDLVVGWTRSVDVRVSWDEQGRPGRSVVFSSIRYNREAI